MDRRAAPSLALALLILVSGAAARPGSAPICPVCGVPLDEFAAANGIDLEVERSTVTVAVAPDGDARWTVRNRVADAAALDRLRERPRLLDLFAREHSDAAPVGGARNVSTAVEGWTVVVRFEDPDAAGRMPGGALLVESLHADGPAGYRINADRFTVVGPEGTVAANDPPDARVEGRRITWTRGETRGGHVAFAPEPGAEIRGRIAVGAATASLALARFAGIGVSALILLLSTLGAAHLIARR